MRHIDDLLDGVKNFRSQITNTVIRTLKDNEHIIVEFVTEEQLYEKGEDGDGEFLADSQPYRPMTISIKRIKGQPTNRVTLKDTGDFHESFYIEFQSEWFEIKAKDWKSDELQDRYGDAIMALNDENITDMVQNYIAPAIMEKFKQI